MSKTAGTTQTTSTTGLPSNQQPYYDKLFSEAGKLYNSPGPQYYPGETVAPLDPTQIQAQGQMRQAAGATSNLFQDQVTPAINTGLNAYDVANNPYVKNYANAAVQPIYENLTQQALPAIAAGANASGTRGSSRQGIAEGQAITGASRAAGETTAGIYNNAYGQGLNVLQSTLGQIPSLVSAYAQPANMLASIGSQNREVTQANINEEIARYTHNQNLPYNKLTEYANAITVPSGGTSSTLVEGTPADSVSQWISAVLGGTSAASGIWDLVNDVIGGGGKGGGNDSVIDLGDIYKGIGGN